MQAILLQYFAAQQQASTFRRQKLGLFFLKFSAEFNKLSFKFKKQQESDQKMAKTEIVQKTVYMWHSGPKG